MGASHEITLDPMGFLDLNRQLLDIVVAGESILSSESAAASAKIARPFLKKVKEARRNGSPILVEEEELDILTAEHLNKLRFRGVENPQAKDLRSTLFTLHSAWDLAGGPPRPAFQEFQSSIA